MVLPTRIMTIVCLVVSLAIPWHSCSAPLLGACQSVETAPERQAEQRSSGAHERPPAEKNAPFDQRLAAGKFAVRRAAMLDGWKKYDTAHDQIERLAATADPESRARAAWIMDRWEIGLFPEIPDEVQRELAAAQDDPARALGVLIDHGSLRQGVHLARKRLQGAGAAGGAAAGGSSDLELAQQMAQVVASRYPTLLLHAIEQDQLDAVLELLDLCSQTPSLVAARAILLERLGRPLDPQTVVPACGAQWAPQTRDELAILALATAGKLALAEQLAADAARDDLRERILLLAGDWKARAEISRQRVNAAGAAEVSLEDYGNWLLSAREAGMVDEVQQATAAILAFPSLPDPDYAWRVLMIGGQAEAAVNLAASQQPWTAAELVAAAGDLPRALRLLEIDPSDPRSGIAQHIAQLRKRIAEGNDLQTNRQIAITTTALRMLGGLGYTSMIDESLVQLTEIMQSHARPNMEIYELVRTAIRLGHPDLLPRLLATASEQTRSSIESFVGFVLAERSQSFLPLLHRGVTLLRPQASAQEQWRMALELLGGKLPEEWNRDEDLDRLHPLITRSNPDDNAIPLADPTPMAGNFFSALGRRDLALASYKQAAHEGSARSRLKVCDMLRIEGRLAEALEGYQRLRTEQPTDLPPPPRRRMRRGNDEELLSPLSLLASQATVLRQQGNHEAAERYFRVLELMPLDPMMRTQEFDLQRLEELLLIAEENDVARHHLRFLIMAGDTSFYSEAIELALRLFESAADGPSLREAALWAQIAVIGTVDRGVLYPSGYVTIPAQWHLMVAAAALQDRDEAGVAAAMERALNQFPMNIDLGEKEFPKLRAAGMSALADQLLDRILEIGLQRLHEVPTDANTWNNLAWVAAVNDRHLDRARLWAQQAVFLEPDSTSYRDTLAEVLFRQGHVEEAVRIERQCLIDAPDLWHLHEQLARFEAAPQTADPATKKPLD